MPTMRRAIHEKMKTAAELQARREHLRQWDASPDAINSEFDSSETIELIDEVLRLRKAALCNEAEIVIQLLLLAGDVLEMRVTHAREIAMSAIT